MWANTQSPLSQFESSPLLQEVLLTPRPSLAQAEQDGPGLHTVGDKGL